MLVQVLMFLQTGSLTLLFPFLPLHMKERGFTVSQVTFIRQGLGIFGCVDAESALVQKITLLYMQVNVRSIEFRD